MGAWFEDGHLWVLGWAAAIDWHRGLGRARRGEGGREFYPIDDYSALYDGIIDVIDLETHRVIAHRRLSSAAAILRVAPGWVAGVREGSDGWWYADILRVRLTGT